MIADKIEKLKETGLYPCLVKGGVIPIKVNFYFELYEHYKTRLAVNQSLRNARMQSLMDTSEDFKCCETTVSKAIRFMKQEV